MVAQLQQWGKRSSRRPRRRQAGDIAPGNEKPGHLAVGEHYYLGNLVLRSGDAYVTDATAAGMRALGRGEDCNYAIVHKVPPTACSQFALIVDWVFA